MTKKTGEVMEDYSKENKGFIGKMAAIGGRINKSVGSAVEKIAQDGKSGELGETKSEQFVEANKIVWNSAANVVIGKESNEKETIIEAQKRLKTLGYAPGPADGILGDRMRAAITKYQKQNGLEITTALDENTLNSLEVKAREFSTIQTPIVQFDPSAREYNKDNKIVFDAVRSTLRKIGARISSVNAKDGLIETKQTKCKDVKMPISQGAGCMKSYIIEVVPLGKRTKVYANVVFYHQSWDGSGWVQADDDRQSVMDMEIQVNEVFFSKLESAL